MSSRDFPQELNDASWQRLEERARAPQAPIMVIIGQLGFLLGDGVIYVRLQATATAAARIRLGQPLPRRVASVPC